MNIRCVSPTNDGHRDLRDVQVSVTEQCYRITQTKYIIDKNGDPVDAYSVDVAFLPFSTAIFDLDVVTALDAEGK